MKIIKSIVTILAMVGLVSCDHAGEGVDGAGNGTPRRITFNLDMCLFNGMQPGGTRAADGMSGPRELLDRRPGQRINDMRVYVFRSDSPNGTYLYYNPQGTPAYYSVSDFDNSSDYPDYSGDSYPYPDQEFETHACVIEPRLENGYYKFLAVGRDDKGARPLAQGDYYPKWGAKFLGDVSIAPGARLQDITVKSLLDIEDDYVPYYATEIFTGLLTPSGETDYVTVTDGTKAFYRQIMLKRAVAGLYVCVTDIPSEVYDDKTGRPFTPTEIDIEMDRVSNVLYLASRTGVTQGAENIDFRPIVAHIELASGGWNIEGDGLVRPATEYEGVRIPANAAMASNYLIPVQSDDIRDATFYLVFKATRGREMKHSIPCKIIGATQQGNEDSHEMILQSPYRFPVEANCIYSIGSLENPLSLAGTGSNAPKSAIKMLKVL